MAKMLGSQSMGPDFKTYKWLQDQLSLLPFQGRLSEYKEVMGTKSKLSPQIGSVVLRQLNPIHQNGPYSLFFLINHKYSNTKCNPTPKTYSNYEGIVALQIILLHNPLTKREFEGWVHYILLVCFLNLKESTRETGENVFYFTTKALSILVKIKF